MKTARELSNQELILETERHVELERNETLTVLELLRENERRRLFAQLGYSSLFTYMVENLKYSEGAAFRRIKAMRLIRDNPKAREAIQEGRISLTTAAQVQAVFESRKLEPSIKIEILQRVENQSKTQVQRTLAPLLPPEKRKHFLQVDEELHQKLEAIKKHIPHQDTNDLLHQLADAMLQRLKTPRRAPATSPDVRTPSDSLKREVWRKNEARCQYQSPNGVRCAETEYLQFDHIQPFALGGETSPENLRLLCPAHNQLQAIQSFGVAKMRGYLGDVEASSIS